MSRQDYTEEEITTALMALVAWAGNSLAAARYLKAEKDINLTGTTLNRWKQKYAIRFDEMREKYSQQMEKRLEHELRDVAALAVETERLAIEKARTRLQAGDDQDPGRTAANLARVAQSSTDKMLSISGRATSRTEIVDTRGAQEIVRSLISMGVIKPTDQPQIAEAAEADSSERTET